LETMGLFEHYPWVLIPLIVITIEGWTALKNLIKRWFPQKASGRITS